MHGGIPPLNYMSLWRGAQLSPGTTCAVLLLVILIHAQFHRFMIFIVLIDLSLCVTRTKCRYSLNLATGQGMGVGGMSVSFHKSCAVVCDRF
jgi:hypothetical protein